MSESLAEAVGVWLGCGVSTQASWIERQGEKDGWRSFVRAYESSESKTLSTTLVDVLMGLSVLSLIVVAVTRAETK